MEIPSKLIETLRQASHVTVLTGAGISAESGVPTFRDAQTGLWAQYEPEQLATRRAFRQNPPLVWQWYQWRRQLISQAQPNPAHYALVELEKRLPKLTLITQNVDGLHGRAGSQQLVELHGNIQRCKCFDEDHPAPATLWQTAVDTPPACPQCGSLLRPDVVWFGESLPSVALHTAVRAARNCSLFLAVGTSALVHPAASLPLEARQYRIPVVEINPAATPLTPYADYVLTGPAGQLLPALLQQTWPAPPLSFT